MIVFPAPQPSPLVFHRSKLPIAPLHHINDASQMQPVAPDIDPPPLDNIFVPDRSALIGGAMQQPSLNNILIHQHLSLNVLIIKAAGTVRERVDIGKWNVIVHYSLSFLRAPHTTAMQAEVGRPVGFPTGSRWGQPARSRVRRAYDTETSTRRVSASEASSAPAAAWRSSRRASPMPCVVLYPTPRKKAARAST